jgi:ABC-2 type transport system ATP-binding protein
VLDYLQAASIHVESLTVHMPDLDDVFLALTGRPPEEHRTEEKEAAR